VAHSVSEQKEKRRDEAVGCLRNRFYGLTWSRQTYKVVTS